MELTPRKKQILKVVTERYIDSAEPVGSKYIAQAMDGKVSPNGKWIYLWGDVSRIHNFTIGILVLLICGRPQK